MACGSNEIFIPDSYEKNFITLGNGGGFTGAVNQFYLLENGKVFKSNSRQDTLIYLGKLDKGIVLQQFENYKTCGFDTIEIDSPGNMYYFLADNRSGHKLTWGSNTIEPPSVLVTFHANLSRLIKQLNENF
jgi:hypothetical protein